ncbi:hypothetical protein FOS14_19680 [Skermania sp. ID1734]|uniref:hypothetical protein n=1 Tax=Skermania sp. ID1734 TaxID=2597516 RepID=UPI00117E7D30|nr:hypothetical protein [Skermania sp. ID1734]TSD94864.1 hypothetical protein FOS14_19680 [Skermania sp. ID1734]
MTTSPDPVAAPTDGEKAPTCRFPGCTRPPRPTPATGRPTQYCEQADPDGPLHTAANAWKARHKAQRGRNVTATQRRKARRRRVRCRWRG